MACCGIELMIEWNDIAKLVEENWELYDGFIILSGTDTLVSHPKGS
jgi:L-asparaginase/Glu-tRNA(Gln) amidotransferase subunit D